MAKVGDIVVKLKVDTEQFQKAIHAAKGVVGSRRIFFTQDAKFAVTKPAEDKPVTLTGYALVWNTLSQDRGGYKVRLKPKSAKIAPSALALYHHDYKAIIGNTENDSLRFAIDDTGVKVEIDLPDTTVGNDVAELVGEKYINGMSFGMLLTPEPKFDVIEEDGITILEFSEFTLDEVTVTGIPAFDDTTIEIKPEAEPADDAPAFSRDAYRRDRAKLDRLKLSMIGL